SRIRWRIRAPRSSPCRSIRSRVLGVTSSPRASRTIGTTARRAATSWRVSSAASHKPPCAGSAPYCDPSEWSLRLTNAKCIASSAATDRKSPTNSRPISAPNRPAMSSARSIATNSMCAIECQSAMVLCSEPPAPRFGIRLGGNSSSAAGQAGRSGMSTSKRQASSPRRQARATARAAMTFSRASPVSKAVRIAWATDVMAVGSQGPRRFEHFVRMAFHLDLAPDARDPALGIDEIGRPVHAHEQPAVELLLTPDAQGIRQSTFGVSRERHREAMLGGELGVLGRWVLADAEHRGARLLELWQQGGEILVLDGAAWRIVLWIKEDDQLTAPEIGRADGAAVRGFESDVGHQVAHVGTIGHHAISKVSPKISAHAVATPCRASSSACKSAG